MSRVYFHTEHDGTAELLGSERAWMGGLCTDIAAGMVPDEEDQVEAVLTPHSRLRPWLEPDRVSVLPRWVRTYLSVGGEPIFQHEGTPLSNFDLVLNTALCVGSDPVCLMARLHGQCEINAYVEGPDRAWMAAVIEQGRAMGVMRSEAGWEDVVKLLRLRDDAPVVCSYSVTEGFPNALVADWAPPEGYDEDDPDAVDPQDLWYDLPPVEQWRLALSGLRSQPRRCLRQSAEALREPFGHTRSMLDLFA